MSQVHTAPMPTLIHLLRRRSSAAGSPPWGLVEAVGAATLVLAMLGSTLAGFEVARASAPQPLTAHAPRATRVVAAREASFTKPEEAPEKADAPAPAPADDVVATKPRSAKPSQRPRYPWMRH